MDYENIKSWIIIILIIFILFILVFYLFEKNTAFQPYLNEIQQNVSKLEKRDSLINTNYSLNQMSSVLYIQNFLTKKYFESIKSMFVSKNFNSRNFLLRKASGINFFKLYQSEYKNLLNIYFSNNVLNQISSIIGKPVQRITLSDPNACSLLIYSNEGDYINWHYDYSGYYGDRYVVLLTIVNENANQDGLSNNEFIYKINGKNKKLKMHENSLIIFKGSEILHQSTQIKKNEKRILLSMVFCDICQEKKNVFNQIYEKSKNFIVYG